MTVFKPKRDRLYLTTIRNINKEVNKSNVNQRTQRTDACQKSIEITPSMPEARVNAERGESVGKHATSAKRGKTYNRLQARENTQPAPSSGKHTTVFKRGKVQPAPSTGKHTTGAERGQTCNHRQAREKLQPPPSAGKYATGAERGKTCNWRRARIKSRVNQITMLYKFHFISL